MALTVLHAAPRPLGGGTGWRLEGVQQLAQELGERALLGLVQDGQQLALVLKVQRGNPVGEFDAPCGELNEQCPGVGWIANALHESPPLQSAQPVGHRARAAHQSDVEVGG